MILAKRNDQQEFCWCLTHFKIKLDRYRYELL